MKKNKTSQNEFVSADASVKKNNVKEVKNSKKKSGKPGFFARIGSKTKDIFSELKKVSWPSFSKVVKKTGTVIVVVLAFLVVITAFDAGLDALLTLITK